MTGNEILPRVFKSAASLQAVTSLVPLTGIQIHYPLISFNRILIQDYDTFQRRVQIKCNPTKIPFIWQLQDPLVCGSQQV